MDASQVDVASKAAEQAFDLFRRDYLIASVVVLLGVNGIWAYALRGVLRALAKAQEDRVQDGKERVQDHVDGEKRATALAERMAVHMDQSTEAVSVFLATQAPPGEKPKGKARRTGEHPIVEAPK